MTQAQLEVLARSNPLVAKRMKDGFYKDRMVGSAPPAAPRRRRAQAAQLPADPAPAREKPAARREPSRKSPAASRTKPAASRKSPAASRSSSGKSSRPKGFLGGLLGGG